MSSLKITAWIDIKKKSQLRAESNILSLCSIFKQSSHYVVNHYKVLAKCLLWQGDNTEGIFRRGAIRQSCPAWHISNKVLKSAIKYLVCIWCNTGDGEVDSKLNHGEVIKGSQTTRLVHLKDVSGSLWRRQLHTKTNAHTHLHRMPPQ